MRNKIIQGNVLEELKKLPDKSVDCIVTSPPYWGLRDYGEETNTIWGGDENCGHEWGNELRAGGRHKKGETNPGKEAWYKEKGGISPKAGRFCKKCGAWYGQLGLEPTLDMYLEHMLQITAELKRVLKKTGVMFLNWGDCYGGTQGKFAGWPDQKLKLGENIPRHEKPKQYQKCLMLQNYRLILRMIDEQGWILRNIIVWHKPNAMPSSVKDRLTVNYEPVFFFSKSKKYYFDLDAIRIPYKIGPQPFNVRVRDSKKGKGSQYFASEAEYRAYIRKNKKYRGKGAPQNTIVPNPSHGGKNPGSVWTIPTQPFPEAHFATYPEKLITPMIKAGTPQWICKKCGKPRVRIIKYDRYLMKSGIGAVARNYYKQRGNEKGKVGLGDNTRLYAGRATGWTDCGCNAGWQPGIVLDPFMGSGTTGLVAKKLGRDFIGIELNPEYVSMSQKRIDGIPKPML